MEIEFDDEKNKNNTAKHGISFDCVNKCLWNTATIKEDKRFDYGEIRYNAYVLLEDRLHNVVFTKRSNKILVISFRKANQRERIRYEKEKG